MGLKDKVKEMSDQDKLALLATDGMLVKRPILVDDSGEGRVFVGFREAEYETLLKKE